MLVDRKMEIPDHTDYDGHRTGPCQPQYLLHFRPRCPEQLTSQSSHQHQSGSRYMRKIPILIVYPVYETTRNDIAVNIRDQIPFLGKIPGPVSRYRNKQHGCPIGDQYTSQPVDAAFPTRIQKNKRGQKAGDPNPAQNADVPDLIPVEMQRPVFIYNPQNAEDNHSLKSFPVDFVFSHPLPLGRSYRKDHRHTHHKQKQWKYHVFKCQTVPGNMLKLIREPGHRFPTHRVYETGDQGCSTDDEEHVKTPESIQRSEPFGEKIRGRFVFIFHGGSLM